MKAAGVIATVAAVAAAVVAVVLISSSGGPKGTPPPDVDATNTVGAPDATLGEPDAAASEPDTTEPPDTATGKRLIDEVVEGWPGPDSIDRDPIKPISDEDWAANPCNPLAEMIIGAEKVDAETLEAQLSAARSHHVRNTGLDLLTWTYAGCLAVEANDLRPCYETPGVVMPQRCEDNLLVYRLAKATTAEACITDTASFVEIKRDRLIGKQLCRAAAGDASACKNFRQPVWRWYCEALAARDPQLDRCANIADPETRAECPAFVGLLRAARGLPQLAGELDPNASLVVMVHKVMDPAFSCADWYRRALRDLCR